MEAWAILLIVGLASWTLPVLLIFELELHESFILSTARYDCHRITSAATADPEDVPEVPIHRVLDFFNLIMIIGIFFLSGRQALQNIRLTWKLQI